MPGLAAVNSLTASLAPATLPGPVVSRRDPGMSVRTPIRMVFPVCAGPRRNLSTPAETLPDNSRLRLSGINLPPQHARHRRSRQCCGLCGPSSSPFRWKLARLVTSFLLIRRDRHGSREDVRRNAPRAVHLPQGLDEMARSLGSVLRDEAIVAN